MEGHKHFAGMVQEHEVEPVPGLPEVLPEGERILWQASPDPVALMVEAFHLRKIALYFALLLMLRAGFEWDEGASLVDIGKAVLPLLLTALTGLGLIALLGWLSARGALYTLTNRRLVMRIGIVLTVTFNLPLKLIASADVRMRAGHRGHGDIALLLSPGTHIGWLHLWPHARAWHLKRPQPTLRCVPDLARKAERLQEAWRLAHGAPAPANRSALGPASPLPEQNHAVPRQSPVASNGWPAQA